MKNFSPFFLSHLFVLQFSNQNSNAVVTQWDMNIKSKEQVLGLFACLFVQKIVVLNGFSKGNSQIKWAMKFSFPDLQLYFAKASELETRNTKEDLINPSNFKILLQSLTDPKNFTKRSKTTMSIDDVKFVGIEPLQVEIIRNAATRFIDNYSKNSVGGMF